MAADRIEGYLTKQGHVFKTWKTRKFVLRTTTAALEYYDDAAQPPTLKGSISLKRGSSMLDAAGETAFVVIDADGTKYPIKALSPDDKARWMAVLNRVIAGGRDFDEIFAIWQPPRASSSHDGALKKGGHWNKAISDALFHKIDTDGSGFIEFQELCAARRPAAATMFERFGVGNP